uniref:(northern house mosquito) hypothetical protein n=1 Tax=Culex pipiens TaxID=7175 RepID=A0A8D8EV96_CULPI
MTVKTAIVNDPEQSHHSNGCFALFALPVAVPVVGDLGQLVSIALVVDSAVQLIFRLAEQPVVEIVVFVLVADEIFAELLPEDGDHFVGMVVLAVCIDKSGLFSIRTQLNLYRAATNLAPNAAPAGCFVLPLEVVSVDGDLNLLIDR